MLKVEPEGFSDAFNAGHEGEKESEMTPKFFA